MANVLVAVRNFNQCPERYRLSRKDNVTILLENDGFMKPVGDCWSSFRNKVICGTIVEVHKQPSCKISVGVYRRGNGVSFITVDKAIFDEEALSFNEKIVSEYEIFWSAGVNMDPNLLRPCINEEGETSLPGVYYCGFEERYA